MERDKEPCGSGVSGIRGPCTSTTSSQAEGNLPGLYSFVQSPSLPFFLLFSLSANKYARSTSMYEALCQVLEIRRSMK